MDSPFSRVAKRLRGISQLSTQIARSETNDQKAMEQWPEGLREMARLFDENRELCIQYASEIETYKGHRKEDAEALITLAQTAANIATVIGSDGQNLEIITHSDPEFIYGILSRGTPGAIEEACRKLEPEQRRLITKWLRGFDDD
jgi:hypothetical protein